MGWLTFAFSLQKKFEALFGDKLEVVRTRQQQEPMKFLSHFKGRFVIEKGRRKQMEQSTTPSLFEIRSTMGKLTRRAMSTECDATSLNSNFPFVLKVCFFYFFMNSHCHLLYSLLIQFWPRFSGGLFSSVRTNEIKALRARKKRIFSLSQARKSETL